MDTYTLPVFKSSLVQVTVAVVRYTSLARERQGVASTYLAERIKVIALKQCCTYIQHAIFIRKNLPQEAPYC